MAMNPLKKTWKIFREIAIETNAELKAQLNLPRSLGRNELFYLVMATDGITREELHNIINVVGMYRQASYTVIDSLNELGLLQYNRAEHKFYTNQTASKIIAVVYDSKRGKEPELMKLIAEVRRDIEVTKVEFKGDEVVKGKKKEDWA